MIANVGTAVFTWATLILYIYFSIRWHKESKNARHMAKFWEGIVQIKVCDLPNDAIEHFINWFNDQECIYAFRFVRWKIFGFNIDTIDFVRIYNMMVECAKEVAIKIREESHQGTKKDINIQAAIRRQNFEVIKNLKKDGII